MQIYHYHPTTGGYLGTGTAKESPLEPGVYLIPAHAAEIAPPVPGPGEFVAWMDGGWTVQAIPVPEPEPVPTPEDIRAAKLAEISAAKSAKRDGGFLVNGIRFDSDLSARMSYAELAMRLQQDATFSTPWKASEGVWVTMNAAMFAQVYAAGAVHIQDAFAWQAGREAELAATPDDQVAGFVV